MKKIESVIESCTDCRFSKEFQETGGNTDFVLVCTKFDNEEEEDWGVARDKSFLIARASKKIKEHLNIEIPANCPLEDYENLLPSDIIHNCEMKSNSTG